VIARVATTEDIEAITTIYNQGIEDRIATLETRLRDSTDVAAWLGGRYPVAVVEQNNLVLAFAAASVYRPRACYHGIAETSVYVHRDHRGKGAGRMVLQELIRLAEAAGFWKLVSRIFPENEASLALIRSAGFREVGLYEKHGRLDNIWRDVIIVERLIPSNLNCE